MRQCITVRDYRDSDFDACRSLYGEMAQHHADIYEDPSIAGDDPGRGFDVYMKRADRCGAWVAESDGKIVGFTGLLDVVGEEGVAEIEPVITASASRSQGIGTRLIEHVVNEAKIKGFRFLTIRPVLRNEKAFALYVRLGFNHVGSIELFQDLSPESARKWKSGIEICGRKLSY
jgi:GNAT superfamily N-acetyltransferase